MISYAVSTNQAPSVAIANPANGASVVQGRAVAVTATAGDADGTVASVVLYADGNQFASFVGVSPPYTASVTGLGLGSHTLTAVATDNLGTSTTSAGVTITVGGEPSPVVSITSPVGGSSFAAGSTVVVNATAGDGDGSVSKVDFYVDGALVGTDATSSYSASLVGLAAGAYVLTAVATDDLGAGTTSAGVTITVVAGGGGTVTLQEGLNGYAGTRDTYLSAWGVTENNGSGTTLLEGGAYVDLVRFAIFAAEGGPVPNGATITSAQLSWYKTTDYNFTYEARRLLVDWVEGEATWSRPRVGAVWGVAGAGGSGTDYAAVADAMASVGYAPGWLTFDVTGGGAGAGGGAAEPWLAAAAGEREQQREAVCEQRVRDPEPATQAGDHLYDRT